MFETLNRPLLLLALVLIVIALGVDLGSRLLPAVNDSNAVGAVLQKTGDLPAFKNLSDEDKTDLRGKLTSAASSPDKPPGAAIAAMALVDGIVVYGLIMLSLPMLMSQELHGRLSGPVTLIFSIVILIAAIILVITSFIKTLIMVALFTAAPFGTIAYLAIWGFFNRGGAAAILSINMMLKLGFALCLVLAHPRFLQSKGLVLMVLTSFVAILIISFLHGLVPIVLVSITDMIAAIIIGIIVAIWAVVLLIGGIMGLVRAVA
jgi:hypothetical protein